MSRSVLISLIDIELWYFLITMWNGISLGLVKIKLWRLSKTMRILTMRTVTMRRGVRMIFLDIQFKSCWSLVAMWCRIRMGFLNI